MSNSGAPFFSVVIPVYNRESLIRDTLKSVFAQEYEDFEVIVIDDGSTDRTVSVLEEYGDRLTVLQQENQGPGAARNAGIQVARGEYVAFLDSDDLWFPWTLRTYRETIKQYGHPSFIGGKVHYFTKVEEVLGLKRNSLYADRFFDFLEAAGEGEYISTNAAIVRREAVTRTGGFITKNINAEDHDLAFRLGTASGFVQVRSPHLVAVRRHDQQVTGQLRKTWQGLMYLLGQEKAGQYPGGDARKWERRYLLCQHIRSASLDLIRAGYWNEAWQLYHRTFIWQLRFMRFRYIVGFPGAALLESVKHAGSEYLKTRS